MRNDEAIELLCAYGVPLDEEKFCEALNMAIKALKQTDGDLISRQAVLDLFGDIHPLDYNAQAYVSQIKELPTIPQTFKPIAEIKVDTDEIVERIKKDMESWQPTIIPQTDKKMNEAELKEEFEREIEIANKDIDLMPEQEEYMRGYLGGILCAYRIVFGKNYEEEEK